MNLFELAATLKLDTSEYDRGIKSAKASAAVFAKDMIKSPFGALPEKLSMLGDGFKAVGQKLTSFGDKVTSIGRTASIVTAGVGVVLGSAFAKAKDYIGGYESAMTTFKHSAQIGEQGAQALYDALLNVAQHSAYARDHFFKAGQALVAMGLDANTTTKYVQAITDTVAKMGGSGTQIEEMADLFGKLSLQTNLYTQDINQMVTAGIPAWDILATHYHTTTDEVKKMAKDGLLPAKESLNIITDAIEETNEASEMFKYSAAGMANELKQGTLTGALDSLDSSFRAFAVSLLDLDPATESGQENIKALNKTILTFGETMKKIGEKFGFVGDWIRAGIEKITGFLERFNKTIENMPQEQLEFIAKIIGIIAISGPALIIVGKALSTIGSAMSGFGSLLSGIGWIFKAGEGGMVASLTSIGAKLAALGPLLGIIAAVVGVVALAFVFLKEHWDAVVNAWNEWMEKSGLRDTLNSIGQKFSELGEKLGGLHDLFQVLGAICAAVLVPAFAVLMAVFNAIMGAIDGLMTMLGGLIDILSGVGELIVGIFTLDENKIKDGLNKIVLGVFEIFAGFIEGIEKFFGGLLSGITGWFGTTWNEIWSWFGQLDAAIGNWFISIGSSIWNWLSGIGGNIWNWFASIGNWINEKFEKLRIILTALWAVIGDIFEKIKATVWEKFSWIRDKVWEIVNGIKTFISDKFTEARDRVAEIFDRIKNIIFEKLDWARNKAWGIVDGIKNFFVEKFNAAKDAVFGVFDNIKNGIREKLDAAKDVVSGIINKIKGFFSFQFEWPKIPLPHFKVTPDGWQIGDLLKGQLPWLDIDWYAKGGIFTKPTLFPTANGFNGVGEAGAEAVLPIEVLRGYIVDAMAEGVREAQIAYKDSASGIGNAGMVNALISALQGSQKEINVYIGSKQVASEIYDPLMDIMKNKEVYVGA